VRVLAIDYGERRLGLAVSDEAGEIAFPAGALERKGGQRDLDALKALVAERGVARVVVGLPLHMDGRAGPGARAAQAFAKAVGHATGLPVDTFDERWSTREAERSLREQGFVGRRGRKGRENVDSVAATLILQAYLARAGRAAAPEREAR
jgi:putative Holliday junction resolvase